MLSKAEVNLPHDEASAISFRLSSKGAYGSSMTLYEKQREFIGHAMDRDGYGGRGHCFEEQSGESELPGTNIFCTPFADASPSHHPNFSSKVILKNRTRRFYPIHTLDLAPSSPSRTSPAFNADGDFDFSDLFECDHPTISLSSSASSIANANAAIMGASETSPPSSSSVFRTNSAADCAISLDLPMMRPSPLAPSVPFQSFLALDHTQAACIPQHDGVEGCDDLDVQGEDQQEGKTKMQGSQPILIPTASEMRKLKMLKKDLNLTSPSSLDLDLPIMHPLPPFPNFHRVSTPIRLLRNGIGSGRGEDVNLRANNGNGQSRTTSRPIYPITTHSLKNKQRIRSKIPMRNLHAAFEELPTRPWTPSPRIPSPPHWLLNPTTGFPLNLDLDIGGSERKYPKLTPCLDGADQFDPRHNLLSSFHHPQRQVSSFASRPDTDTGSAPRDRRLLSAWTTPRTPCLGPTKNLPLPPSFPSSYLGERGAKGSKRPRSAAYDASQACKKEQEQKIVQIEVKLRDVMVALESTCSSSSLLPTSPSESASKLSTAAHGEEGAVEVVLTVKVRKGMKVSLIVDAAEC